jgi:hypothetical protein
VKQVTQAASDTEGKDRGRVAGDGEVNDGVVDRAGGSITVVEYVKSKGVHPATSSAAADIIVRMSVRRRHMSWCRLKSPEISTVLQFQSRSVFMTLSMAAQPPGLLYTLTKKTVTSPTVQKTTATS